MKTSDFDYHLPQELIAQSPSEPRDHSRLMILDRSSGEIEHRKFYDLVEYLNDGDVLVFNDSRVIPARMYGLISDTGSKIELLLLTQNQPKIWKALVKPGRRMRKGARFQIDGLDGKHVTGTVLDQYDDGSREIEFDSELDFEYFGSVPLPPYIHRSTAPAERYQTVYAQKNGSIAAPTAGLHFTKALLSQLSKKGVSLEFVTLHVGWDSFRPLNTEDPSQHLMHSEYWELSQEVSERINLAKRDGRRIISAGTTAVRLLENAANINVSAQLGPGSGWADIFIKPGYQFRVIDGLITNFHLPKSTLLMLTSALAGKDNILNGYKVAVDNQYRFYSFGDAMFIV
ncbi:MAG TPA: tRNA preQ1(34) S-adenosylmethionine ribosyltransferase-isomerase QueA [Dehalococcoidia bacterium]|nr:tRNA preQ1(34) S-adenosylmethionine ribosyltransferase-isomerase QueA [Chloroflexota bacterium]HCE75312.1 tRNA preQ1(34) S-adenosylmethionine ribosyltransferase-isomerase QueA [Dehalococcoidia bacterium]